MGARKLSLDKCYHCGGPLHTIGKSADGGVLVECASCEMEYEVSTYIFESEHDLEIGCQFPVANYDKKGNS